MFKKISCCLAVALLLVLSAGDILAESKQLTNADGYVYTLDDDGYATLVGYAGSGKKLEIPAELDGHTLVCIAKDALTNLNQLVEVAVPDTVKVIEQNAFCYCSKLKTVYLSEGLEELGNQVFQQCTSLQNINIPNSVVKIGFGVFINCNALKSVKISLDHPLLTIVDGVLFTREDHRLLWYPASKKDKSYQIPEGTTKISSSAFMGSKVVSVKIPESVVEIGYSAFDTCTNLKEVNIPSEVRELNAVFEYCTKLENVSVASDNEVFESIDGVLFQKQTHMLVHYPAGRKDKAYEIPFGTEIIGNSAFTGVPINDVIIPESVRQINNNAFGSTELKSVVLPEGIEKLQSGPFMNCGKLAEVTIPYSLASINWNPFSNCTSLKQVNIPEDHPFLAIMDGALVVKDEMKLVWYPIPEKAATYQIPDGVKQIAPLAFANCDHLKEVIIPEGVETLSFDAFNDCNLDRIQLPESLMEIDKSAFEFAQVKTFVVVKGSYAENFVQAYHLNYEYAN